MTRYNYETKKPCVECRREVDAVRIAGESGLRHARHLHRDGVGLCAGSLGVVPDTRVRR